VHFYNDLTTTINAPILVFPPELCPDFVTQLSEYLPENPVISFDKSPELFDCMNLILKNDREKPRHHHAVIRALISALVGTALQQLKLTERSKLDIQTTGQIVKYCVDHFREPLSLDDISEALHISKYHISHLFSQKIRIGFSDFINMLRIQEACRLLKQGIGITQASVQAGFNSIRSFNRVFLKQTGLTPLKYQKKYRQQEDKEHLLQPKGDTAT
jgi:AraC-like DNA-binding protein